MASERMNTLDEAPATKTGYNFIMDKTGNARAYRADYDTILAEFIAADAPVVSTPTIVELVDGDTVTTAISKKVVHGKINSVNINFSVSVTDDKTQGSFSISGDSIGTVGQSLNAIVDGVFAPCEVTDDSPLTVLINWTGLKSGATDIFINGTLITT